ncbi:chemotaxis protein : Sensory box histidine kinase / response regulator OS=Desulfobacterium autotrophicum (strain ATCC 43914 / DSM 3382 / HRM2) GN=HRM2_12560 PE=4 SV=1: Response_reg [Gemmata massiliana]|uniref:Response regulatory domain-containing protein n=1 Tax=Gemmata massiliana TaxID=1210884 RepID=A0A6P2CXH0_9BACT|nr:response regulator [Gemmata massiliana]VTR92855.1 chemotaxis protein : Sensory box histidine kinase / response regulator OS=Desulfobacterium autotrophicum (strain ATCC 43914 / DSM 3382 / HRM2) GN=HRM2_12560 PE=4 SV=1: Response_reg [Gemmata massiliana]
MDHAALTREACELLRTATTLRQEGHWSESVNALKRATALIRQMTEAMDVRRREIAERVEKCSVPRPVILVVDDERGVLRFLTRVLVHAGFDVLSANSGPEAVTRYRAWPNIDLALIDAQMPAPWDGPQTLAELKRIGPHVRAVFTSDSGERYSARDLLEFGALRVIPKPFPEPGELVSELRTLLKSF